MSAFFRFPRTPHLNGLAHGAPRDDKALTSEEARTLLSAEVVVEEKVDGANLGLSLDDAGGIRAQSRGQYLARTYSGQFKRLTEWLAVHGEALSARLAPELIVFGEWCAARHSLDYTRLPDWWLVFDVYDRERREFLSTARRNAFVADAGLDPVAQVYRGRTTLGELQRLLMDTTSRYRDGPMEGLMVRQEAGASLQRRAKLVRPEFVQAIDEHWSSRRLQWNRVDPHAASA